MRSAAILAGGQATRFGGRDKGALVVEGRTILDRQIAELSSVCDDILIVGGGSAHQSARSIPDTVPGSGPLGGLHAALTEARGDGVFLLACDMPYVTAAFVAYLFALASDVDVVVPQTEDGYHPLCAVYRRECLEPAARRLADGRLKMTDLFADVRVRTVMSDDIERFGNRHRLLANVNTPAEYAGLEALQGHEL